MKTLVEIEIDTLNQIQCEWMALSADASESEKERVFEQMKKIPESFITGRDGAYNLMLRGMPLYATGQTLRTVKDKAADHGIRTDIAWSCNGERNTADYGMQIAIICRWVAV